MEIGEKKTVRANVCGRCSATSERERGSEVDDKGVKGILEGKRAGDELRNLK